MKNFKDLIKVADVYGTETRQAHELSEATLDENWFTDSVNAIKNALGISDDEAKKLIDKKAVEKGEKAYKAPDGSASSGTDGPADAAAKAPQAGGGGSDVGDDGMTDVERQAGAGQAQPAAPAAGAVGDDGMTDVERQAGAGAKPSTAQQAANTYAGGDVQGGEFGGPSAANVAAQAAANTYAGGDVQGGEFGNTPTAKTTAQAAADEYAGGDTTNGEFGANPNDPMSAANQAKDRRAPADPNDPMSAANQAKDRVSPNDPMSAANQAKDRQAPLQDPTGGVGGADAAAKAANDAPISVTAPKAAQPAKPARLDIKTPNLMKAYNAGGKKAMPNIKTMQLALSKAGHDPKGNDGKYGPGTFAAVKSFQQANGLTADGQAGPSTMKKLQLVSQTVKEASMNISMNGTDSKEVADLVDILKNAGVEKPEELAMKNMPTMSLSGPNSPLNKGPIGIDSFDGGPMDDTPRSSMDRPSSGPFDGGPMDDTPRSSMGMDKPAAMGKDKDSKPCGVCGGMHEEYDAIVAEWDNSPDPAYSDVDYMINDLAGGINRPKKSFAPVNGGDNPMKLSVKETLQKALKEAKQSKKWK